MAAFLLPICGLIYPVLVLLAALWCRKRLFFFTRVKGRSMMPTLTSGSFVVSSIRRLRRRGVARGDIVICRFPNRGKTYFIKRAVGIPGDTVRREAGVTYLNEAPLDARRGGPDYEPYTLGTDEYFCVGDNRSGSHDSRDWQRQGAGQVGPIRRGDIAGIVTRILYRPERPRRRKT